MCFLSFQNGHLKKAEYKSERNIISKLKMSTTYLLMLVNWILFVV